MAEMLGYTQDEMMGKHLFEFMDANGVKDAAAKLKNRQKGLKEQHEFEFVHRNGTRVCTLIETVPLFDNENQYAGSLASVMNISERKKAENELAAINETLKEAQSFAKIGSWWYDPVTQMPTWTEEMFHIFGLEPQPEALPYDEHRKIIHPDDWERFDSAVNRSITDGIGYDLELTIIRPSGEIRYVNSRCEAERDESGEIKRLIGTTQDITGIKNILLQLEKRNTDLRLAQEIASIGTWSLDPKIGIPEWSDEIYRIYERDPKLGPYPLSDYETIYRGRYWERFNTAIQGAIKDGTPYDIELKLELPSGNVKWVHAMCEPEPELEPKGRKLRGTIQDISERKQAEIKIKESEERFKLAMEFANDGLYDWNLETNEIYYSPSWKRMLGYEDDELPNDFSIWEKLTEAEDVKRSWKMQNELINKKRDNFKIEFKMKHKNGHWVDILSRANAIFNEDNKAIRIIGTHVDITERKQAETSLLQKKKEAERYLNLAGVMFIGLDRYGNVNVANEKACEVLECANAEIVNQNWFDNFIPQRIRKNVRNVFKQLMEGEIEPVEYYENPVITKNGKEKAIAWHNTVIMDEDNHAIGILGSGEDITEKLKLQAQLHQAQKMEAIGNLAGGIAHDFNNILSSIIGFTELALDETQKGTTLEDSLQEVYAAGKRAKDLVKQILAFARQSEEKLSSIQPSVIAKEVLKFIRSTIPTTIEVQQEIESDALIMGNATQIHQVLMNLCTNAAHAMENSGGILIVSLKDVVLNEKDLSVGMKSGEYAEITVSDSGVGIAPETIESIFEPYFTTKRVGEGTGMGLAMVRGVVESYGGTVNVHSQLGKGATFTIYLPITKRRSAQGEYIQEQLPTGTERILFVDDEAPIAKMGGQTLERLGYSVTTRTSSIEALELFKTKPDDFDIVVTDMTMPNLTGDQLSIEMMKIRSDIPVILCTGYSRKISDEIASEIGIKAFAYKPVVKADLAKTVRKVLDEAKG